MLPSWPDCNRRTAAKQYKRMVKAAGYDVRDLMPSIGAAVGTAVHASLAHVLRHKQSTGELGSVKDGLEIALQTFRQEIAPGAEWDDTTPNLPTAEFQIARMSEAYLPIAQTIVPLRVETEMRATIAPGWILTGHIDLYAQPKHLDDTKTGALMRPYQAQLGGYAMLADANGLPVDTIGTTYIPRGKKSKPQPPPERQLYDLHSAKRAAYGAIMDIKRGVEEFQRTGDAFAFSANPMSLMCSPRYCPAHGTKFCNLHLPQRGIEYVCD